MQLPHSIFPPRNVLPYNMLFNLFTMFIVYLHPPQLHPQLICKLRETRDVFRVCSPLYSKYLKLSLTWCLIILGGDFQMSQYICSWRIFLYAIIWGNVIPNFIWISISIYHHLGTSCQKNTDTYLSIWALGRYKVNTGSCHIIMILPTVASIYYSMSVGLVLPVYLHLKYILFYYKLLSFALHIVAKT